MQTSFPNRASLTDPFNIASHVNAKFYNLALLSIKNQLHNQFSSENRRNPTWRRNDNTTNPLYSAFTTFPLLYDPSLLTDFCNEFADSLGRLHRGTIPPFYHEVFQDLVQTTTALQAADSHSKQPKSGANPNFNRSSSSVTELYRLIAFGQLYDPTRNRIDFESIEAILAVQRGMNPVIVAKEIGFLFIYLVSVVFFITTNTTAVTTDNQLKPIHLSHQSLNNLPEQRQTQQILKQINLSQAFPRKIVYLSAFIPHDFHSIYHHISQGLDLLSRLIGVDLEDDSPAVTLPSTPNLLLSRVSQPSSPSRGPTKSIPTANFLMNERSSNTPSPLFLEQDVHNHSEHSFGLGIRSFLETARTRLSFFQKLFGRFEEFLNVPFVPSEEYEAVAHHVRTVSVQGINALKLCPSMSPDLFDETVGILSDSMEKLEEKLLVAFQTRLPYLFFRAESVDKPKPTSWLVELVNAWIDLAPSVPKSSLVLQSFLVNTGLVGLNALMFCTTVVQNFIDPSFPIVDHIIDLNMLSLPKRVNHTATSALSMSFSFSMFSYARESSRDLGRMPSFSQPIFPTFAVRALPDSVRAILNLQFLNELIQDPSVFLNSLLRVTAHAKTILPTNDCRQGLMSTLSVHTRRMAEMVRQTKTMVLRRIHASLSGWRREWNQKRTQQESKMVFSVSDAAAILMNVKKHFFSQENPSLSNRNRRETEQEQNLQRMSIDESFIRHTLELQRVHRLVWRDSITQKLIPTKDEMTHALLFTASFEEIVGMMRRNNNLLSNLPPPFGGLFRVPILVMHALRDVDILRLSYNNTVTREILQIGPIRESIIAFFEQLQQKLVVIDTHILSLARLNFFRASDTPSLSAQEHVEKDAVLRLLRFIRDTVDVIKTELHDAFDLTLLTVNNLSLSLSRLQKRHRHLSFNTTLLSTFEEAGFCLLEDRVFYGDRKVFEMLERETRKILASYWDLFVGALHHSMMSTFKLLTLLFTPAMSDSSVELARTLPQVKVHASLDQQVFHITPTSTEITAFLTDSVSQFNLLIGNFEIWDFDYLSKHWRVFSPTNADGSHHLLPPSPRTSTATTTGPARNVWTEVSSSSPLIRQTFVYLATIPRVPPVSRALFNRFHLFETIIRNDPADIRRKMPLLLKTARVNYDLPTFSFPSSFAAVDGRKRVVLIDDEEEEGMDHIQRHVSFYEILSNPPLKWAVVPSSFIADEYSPSHFDPDEQPYVCSTCHNSFVSIVSFTNHVHDQLHHRTPTEKHGVIVQALQKYLLRSMERLQLWKETIMTLNASLGESRNLSIPQPTRSLSLPHQLFSILQSLFSPAQLTLTLQIDFTSILIGQMYVLVTSIFSNYLDQYVRNVEEYSNMIAQPLIASIDSITQNKLRRKERILSTTALFPNNTVHDVSNLMKNMEIITFEQSLFDRRFDILLSFCSALSHLSPGISKRLQNDTLILVKLNEELTSLSSLRTTLNSRQSQIIEQLLLSRNTLVLSLDVFCTTFETIRPIFESTEENKQGVMARHIFLHTLIYPALVHIQYLHDLNTQEAMLDSTQTFHPHFRTVTATLQNLAVLYLQYSKLQDFQDQIVHIRFNNVNIKEQLGRFSQFQNILTRLKLIRHSVVPPLARIPLHITFKSQVQKLRQIFQIVFDINPQEFKTRHWVQLAKDINAQELLGSVMEQEEEGEKSPTMKAILDSNLHKHLSTIISIKMRAHHEARNSDRLRMIVESWENDCRLVLTTRKNNLYIDDENSRLEEFSNEFAIVEENSIFDIVRKTQHFIEELQTLASSKHSHPFLADVQRLLATLRNILAPLTMFMKTQRNFLSLVQFFSSRHNAQAVSNIYFKLSSSCFTWHHILLEIKRNPAPFISFAEGEFILQVLENTSMQFEELMSDLNDYIQTKKQAYPILNLLPEEHVITLLSVTDTPADFNPIIQILFPNTTAISFQTTFTTRNMTPLSAFSPPNSSEESLPPPHSEDADVFATFQNNSIDGRKSPVVESSSSPVNIQISPSTVTFANQLDFRTVSFDSSNSLLSINPHVTPATNTPLFHSDVQFQTLTNNTSSFTQAISPRHNSLNPLPLSSLQMYLVDGVFGTLGEFISFHTPLTFVPGGDNIQFLIAVKNELTTAMKMHTIDTLFEFPSLFFKQDGEMGSSTIFEALASEIEPINAVASMFMSDVGQGSDLHLETVAPFLKRSITQTVFFSFFSVWSSIIHSQLGTMRTEMRKESYFKDFISDDHISEEAVDHFLRLTSNLHNSDLCRRPLDAPIIEQMALTEKVLVNTIKTLQHLSSLLRSPLEIVKVEQAILATLNILSIYSFFHHYPIHGKSISFETSGYIMTTFPVIVFDPSPLFSSRLSTLTSSIPSPTKSTLNPSPDTVKATVFFDTAQIEYGFEYLGQSVSTLDSWNFVSRITPPKQFDDAINNKALSFFFRSTEFWTNLARNAESVYPPSLKASSVKAQPSENDNLGLFTLLNGVSPFVAFDRLNEFAALCGRSVRHLMLSQETVTQNTLPDFITAIVSCGFWGCVENISTLLESYIMSLSSILQTLLQATRDCQPFVQFPNALPVKITPGFYLFMATPLKGDNPDLTPHLKSYFRTVNTHPQTDSSRLYVHFTLDGLLYSYQLTERVMTVLDELRLQFAHSSVLHEGLVTHLCHSIPTYLEVISLSILPSIEALEGTTTIEFLHPLLVYLNKASIRDTYERLGDTSAPDFQAEYQRTKAHLSDVLTFVIENMAVMTSIWEFVKVILNRDETPAFIRILLACFPEICDIFFLNTDITVEDVTRDPSLFTKQWLTTATNVEKKYSEDIVGFVSNLLVSHVSYAATYTHTLKALTTLDTEPLPLVEDISSLLRRTDGSDELTKFRESLVLSSEIVGNSKEALEPNQFIPLSPLFQHDVAKADERSLNETVVDVSEERLKFLTPSEVPRHSGKVSFDQRRAVAHDIVDKKRASGLVLQLDEVLRHPLWTTTPLTRRTITNDSPLVIVGPPGSGKSYLIHLLALAQNAHGVNARIVHMNPSNFSQNELFGSFTVAEDFVTDTIGASTFPLQPDSDEYKDILSTNSGFSWEGAFANKPPPPQAAPARRKKWNRGFLEMVAGHIEKMGESSSTSVYFVIQSTLCRDLLDAIRE
ncbi:putative Dynein heavy chain, N-terminal region 2 [Blattamonas nauphoetae]|uniref:Dynein heavy chain, N-terminal region 2 n=1 Tax=Blattamonas nauphoetae TaxID=2049346 RepID=A0ABQ9WUV5_9EUKA|nr:putative Dynein heavy chain, N-terminal region 2 [Blattamonas nauphoetae]